MESCIDIVRHGEPVGGRAYRGNGVDDPLSDLGWQQMRSILNQQHSWQHVISSPMRRCREFAAEVAGKYRIELEIDNNLREVGFGSWEGRTPAELKASHRQEYDAFFSDPVNNRPRGAEPLQEFYQRSVDALSNIAETYAGERVLVLTHAGVMRAIMVWIMQAPLASMYRIKIGYASVLRVRVDNAGGRIEI